MSLAKITSRASENIQETIADIHWTRAVAAGSFLTSVVLLISGKRKAALAVAAAGTVVALMEDPDAVRHFWNSVPDYVQSGQKFLGRVEGFVEELASQGDNLRKTLGRIS
jgi:hypothetical protein